MEHQPVIQTIQRASDILNCFDAGHKELSAKDVGEKLGLNVNTVRGIMISLASVGYLFKNAKGATFSLGLEHLFKSKLVYDSLVKNIKEASEAHLQRIANKGNYTCKLQIATNNKIYTVDTVTSETCHYQFTINTETVLPLHSTASGKLVLAYLPEDKRTAFINSMELTRFTEHTITDRQTLFETIRFIQESDYATEFEETDLGISSVAVPLFRRDEFVGTLSVISLASILETNYRQVISDLIKAAHQISSRLS